MPTIFTPILPLPASDLPRVRTCRKLPGHISRKLPQTFSAQRQDCRPGNKCHFRGYRDTGRHGPLARPRRERTASGDQDPQEQALGLPARRGHSDRAAAAGPEAASPGAQIPADLRLTCGLRSSWPPVQQALSLLHCPAGSECTLAPPEKTEGPAPF